MLRARKSGTEKPGIDHQNEQTRLLRLNGEAQPPTKARGIPLLKNRADLARFRGRLQRVLGGQWYATACVSRRQIELRLAACRRERFPGHLTALCSTTHNPIVIRYSYLAPTNC
jgi:hypothetical protein